MRVINGVLVADPVNSATPSPTPPAAIGGTAVQIVDGQPVLRVGPPVPGAAVVVGPRGLPGPQGEQGLPGPAVPLEEVPTSTDFLAHLILYMS